MEWPGEIKIGAITWTINFVNLEELNKKVKGALAAISITEAEIFVYEDMSPQMLDLSIMHELQHAIDFAMGYIIMEGEPQTMILDDVSVEARTAVGSGLSSISTQVGSDVGFPPILNPIGIPSLI